MGITATSLGDLRLVAQHENSRAPVPVACQAYPEMKRVTVNCALLFVVLSIAVVRTGALPAGELLFDAAPQRYAGRPYYWLAEWKLEVTLPADASEGDTLEVLFGSKGPDKRTMYFTYVGRTEPFAAVGKNGFDWRPLPLGRLRPGKTVVLFGKGRQRVAFLAGVRLVGEANQPLTFRPIRVATLSSDAPKPLVWADLPGFDADGSYDRLWNPQPSRPDWSRAERSAKYAGIALTKVQRWLHERCLPVRDEETGLFRATGPVWNYRDTAADCYPFYVWAAYFTDQDALKSVMLRTLEAEQRLCNHIDRLPVPYDMDRHQKIPAPLDRVIFGASEYVKDGLVPIVELTGPDSPWFGRMRELVDDIFKHARVETPYGNIPTTNIEIHGELLQVLPRLYRITGQQKYLDWAHRLADYYLLPGGFVPKKLSDHGCEIVGGLGLLFAVDAQADRRKFQQYAPHMKFMFDEILRRGTNSDGIIIAYLQEDAGPHDDQLTRDGWGYDFLGFLDYDLARGTNQYEAAIRRPLQRLLSPRYKHFDWDHQSRDNVADSVEGGLYLLQRFPVPEAFVWADREIATLLVDHSDPERLWGTHKLEANTVRTVLIHTMLHTRNTIARPWQPGLQLGAAPVGDGICLFIRSEKPYQGRLQFDIPRHRLFMSFTQDWPRMNCVPEWFTVEPDSEHRYRVTIVDANTEETVTGKRLREGLPIRVAPGRPLRLVVQPLPPQ